MLHILKTLLLKYDWSSFFSHFLKREETCTKSSGPEPKKQGSYRLERSKEIDYVEDFDVRDKL